MPKLQKALNKFRTDWLEARPELGRPENFVLCTSAELKETAKWEECKRAFRAETRVGVVEWPRDRLDAKLRDQPGIVADLFGERVAEQFCGPGRGSAWDLGLFRRLAPGSGEKRVDRFLELRDAGQIVRLDREAQRFEAILGGHRRILICGLAGTGKTMSALELSSFFDGGSWRVFYLCPDDTHNIDHLVEGIRSRAFRKGVFVLDDCHLDFGRVERLAGRIAAIDNPNIKLVLTARTPPKGLDFLDPEAGHFVHELREAEQAVEVAADVERYRAIMNLRRPNWRDPPIDRLMAWTGHDLAILDLILDVTEQDDIREVEKIDDLFDQILREIFKAHSAQAFNLKRLAAVAQFDLDLPRNIFPEPFEPKPNENGAAQRFVVVGGRPPAAKFGHASAAELIYRLLAWAHGEEDMHFAAARDCADVLELCQPEHALGELLPRLLRARLKLADDGAIKRELLTEGRVLALLGAEPEWVPTAVLFISALLCRSLPTPPPFAIWLAERLESWAENPETADDFSVIGGCLRALALANASAQRDVELRIGPDRFAELIAARGTLVELLNVLQHSTSGFAAELSRGFNREGVAELLERTIREERSIGTLHFALRGLGKRPLPGEAGRTQLHLFEETLGGTAMARLIVARGTLVELLKVLEHSTSGFAAELSRGFNREGVAELLERTIREERSIGTLHFALRGLGKRPLPGEAGRTQLHLFEETLGGTAMARLIVARGTLVELLKVLEHSTSGFAAELLRGFNREGVAELLERTIREERSIGTLSFALRDLGKRPLPGEADRTQLHLFEETLGGTAMARLIAARGTLVELLKVLEHSTSGFAAELLRGFNREGVAELLERTIREERSIGTLHLALRDLGKRPLPGEADRTQLHLFEETLGGTAMARLIAARGTLFELLKVLQYSTSDFAAELLRAFNREGVAELLERTIREERSIGTLDFALRDLGKRQLPGEADRTQLQLFEETLGVAGFWRLVLGTGNLNHLAFILDALSPAFRIRLLSAEHAPSSDGWKTLASAGSIYDQARFAHDSLALLPNETARRFQKAIEATAATIAETSSWDALGAGLAMAELISDERVRSVLLDGVNRRIDATHLATLRPDDYESATGALSLLWRERPGLRAQLGAALWRLLPDQVHWPRTHRLIVKARFVLTVARSEHVNQDDALRTLRAFAPLGLDIAIDPKSARYHALFLWNLYALWFERGLDLSGDFRRLQHDKTWVRFVDVVKRRLSLRWNNDKLDTLQLAGALVFLVPEMRPRLAELIKGNIKGIKYLADFSDNELKFIPAFLAFKGMALSAPESAIFSPERVRLLLDKSAAYDDRGPAIEHVCEWLKERL